MKLQILDIGCGPTPIAPVVFKPILDQGYEYEVTGVDIDPANNPTVVHDLRDPFPEEMHGKYNLILASHVFEHIDRGKVLDAFKHVAATLAPGGELWVVVPSMEWCAEKILANQFNREVMLSIYGSSQNHMEHKVGFSLPTLRDVVKMTGLVVRKAYQTPFQITSTEADGTSTVLAAVQNIVIGVKPEQE